MVEGSGRVVDRYELHGAIAAGGMAVVYLGRQRGAIGFSRAVAVKRLHPQLAMDPEFVAMFLDEARIVTRIRHPNVIPTIDVVSSDNELFIVMEYAHGESFSRLLRAAKKAKESVSPRIVASIMTGVLHGLHAAHEAKSETGTPLEVVHRDVTPQNILVGVDGEARLLDFGVSKAAGQVHLTREGHVKGKAAYMAPELVKGQPIDRRADIYAASVVLWEALAARRLFDGENDAAIIMQMLEGVVPLPSTLTPSLPRGLDAVVMRGLARDPNDRFPTAREMAVALERAVGLASPRQVGEWVQHAGAEGLAKRDAALRAMESSGTVDSVEHVRAALASNAGLQTPAPRSLTPSSSPLLTPSASSLAPFVTITAPPPAPPAPIVERPAPGAAVFLAPAPQTPPSTSAHETSLGVATSHEPLAGPARTIPWWPFAALAGVAACAVIAVFALRPSSSSSGGAATEAGVPRAPVAPAIVTSAPPAPPASAPSAPPAPPAPPASARVQAEPASSGAPDTEAAATSTPPVPAPSGRPVRATPDKATPSKPAAPPAAAAKANCNPPYTMDAAGIMHVKPQCLLRHRRSRPRSSSSRSPPRPRATYAPTTRRHAWPRSRRRRSSVPRRAMSRRSIARGPARGPPARTS